MARRLVLLLVLAGPALAVGQESEPPASEPVEPAEPAEPVELDEPAATTPIPPPDPAAAEPGLPGAEDVGLGFLLGVAGCRDRSYGEDPLLAGLEVSGTLLDAAGDVRAFFDARVPGLKTGRFYTERACRDLRELAELLRYRAEIREEDAPGGGVALKLELRPMTLVRHVEVRGNAGLFELRLSPVRREEILSRLKLRPGTALEDDPERRRLQLVDEEQRVRAHLVRRGFFDARVTVSVTPRDEPYEVTLRVSIKKGPGYTVGEIGVEGNTAVRNEVITEVLGQRICLLTFLCFGKDRFDYEELRTDLERVREIYQKAGYPGVRVTTTYSPSQSADHATRTVRFKVIVRERKKITVSFVGNRTRDDRGLRNLLTFNVAGAYDDIEAESSAEAIRRSYQASGRFLTTVRFERVRLAPTESCPECDPHDGIVFTVDEGPEQRVRAVEFRGNRAFSDERLADVVVTRPYPPFRYLIGRGGYVTSLQLAQDVQRLVDVYARDGYAGVRVTPTVTNHPAAEPVGAMAAMVSAGDRGGGLYLTFDIVEGTRDVVQAVEHHGNHELSSAELLDRAVLRPGAPFTEDGLAADIDLVRRRYLDRGFLYVDVKAARSGAGPATRVRFDVDEGVKVRAGKVLVRGNFKTRGWIVRDVLGLDEGDVLSTRKLDAGQAGLRGTDLFANIPPPVTVGRDPVNLLVDVEERHDNILEVRVAGGFTSDENVFVTGSTDFRNLSGTGISLALNGELGLERQRAQATLAFPQWAVQRAVRLPLRLELQGRYRNEVTERFGDLETIGVSAVLSRQLASGIFFSLRYDWNRFGRSTELVRPPGVDQDLSNLAIRTTTASLGPLILIDRRRPSALLPTSGYVAQAQVSFASRYLFGTDDFIRLNLGGQLFIPFGGRFVVTQTLRYDQGLFYPGSDEVLLPEVERFTGGGDTTVRGIAEDRLATEIIPNPLLPASDVTAFRLVPAGGNIRFLYKLDAQAQLYRFSEAFSLASAVFLDNGFIANSFFRFDLGRRLRHSLGVALRVIAAPLISLSVEYAFPLDPDLGDDPTGRLHFNLGISF
jgi:outer membrane protein assembly complex protein YaeT